MKNRSFLYPLLGNVTLTPSPANAPLSTAAMSGGPEGSALRLSASLMQRVSTSGPASGPTSSPVSGSASAPASGPAPATPSAGAGPAYSQPPGPISTSTRVAHRDPAAPDCLIRTIDLVKSFDGKTVLNIARNQILRGSIYGLVGPNGAGKTTFLRILAGIYRPDSGICQLNDQPIWEKPSVKERILFLPDQPSFLPQANLASMRALYRVMYPRFDDALYLHLLNIFRLNEKARLKTFSKGMQRQAALTLVIAACPDLLLLDEAFDGLDPVMRQLLKRLVAGLVAEHGISVVISSHNLRELEDFCDHIGLLHNGSILVEQELDELKMGICRVQVAWTTPPGPEQLRDLGLDILDYKRRGSVIQLLVRGSYLDVSALLEKSGPVLLESIPLTLEEIFIQTLEENGYDLSNILA